MDGLSCGSHACRSYPTVLAHFSLRAARARTSSAPGSRSDRALHGFLTIVHLTESRSQTCLALNVFVQQPPADGQVCISVLFLRSVCVPNVRSRFFAFEFYQWECAIEAHQACL